MLLVVIKLQHSRSNMKVMRYLALASDYDGTLAQDGLVNEGTIKALEQLRHSGRKLLLVTGRELPDLEATFPRLDLFERVVAENGGILLNPQTREKRSLAPGPPAEFIEDLKRRGIQNMSAGDVVVATWRPHETAVLESIRELGLDLQVIFNKDAVMVLPTGINKMTGLTQALEDLKLSRHNVVGVGDAENDHAFLNCCECSVAVANAIPALKERVDLVTQAGHGEGVQELIAKLLADDLSSVTFKRQHGILLGHTDDRGIYVEPYGHSILLCGQSGSGKSTFVAGFVERIMHDGYQTCVVDPEGDYENLQRFVTVGDETRPPSFEQVFRLLDDPKANLCVNLIGMKIQDRPEFFTSLLARLQEKKMREARPHWLIVDEAHHLLPSDWAPGSAQMAGQTGNLLLVTVHPEHVSPAALKWMDIVCIVGKAPRATAEELAKIIGVTPPQMSSDDLAPGEVSVWFRDSNRVIERIKAEPGKAERKRHKRKYAEGELEPERVFYFRGPRGKLNLRVQNLETFLQIAQGIDDETWLFHLRRGDFSKWFASAIKDKDLAEEVKRIETDTGLSSQESRNRIAKSVESRYTAPA
jgi:hypothetical protein